jgi:hypothetical protein
MRRLLFWAAVIVSVVGDTSVPATATPLVVSGLNSPSVEATPVEEVGCPLPYAYYPPAYGYYAPPPAYAYYPPVYGYYAPPPAANGDYSSADGDYGDYPPASGDYGDYPPGNGY